jgi:hypothetical protein
MGQRPPSPPEPPRPEEEPEPGPHAQPGRLFEEARVGVLDLGDEAEGGQKGEDRGAAVAVGELGEAAGGSQEPGAEAGALAAHGFEERPGFDPAFAVLPDVALGERAAVAADFFAQVLEPPEADERARQVVPLGVQPLFEERRADRPGEGAGVRLGVGEGCRLGTGGAAAGAGGELVEGIDRPEAAVVLPRHAEEDRLPHLLA